MNKEELEKVEQLIEQKDSEQLKDLLAGLHPADIAELCNELDAEEARFIYLLLDNETAADVLIEMDEDARKEFLEILPSETIAKRFVDYMDSDDAVDIIREMDEDNIVDLLKYDEDTAGGLMGTEMVIVNENWSMPECLKEMRIQAEDMDEIYYVYVVDDDQRLRGVFPLKKMITSPSVSKVKHVMRKEPISVHVDTPIDEVVQTIEKYDLVAVPVVDSIGRLVGRITVDDVMDEVREQAERDYQLASGLSQDVETDDNVFRQTTARLPWLLIGMIGGIGNSMILGNFDSTFAAHPEMALYIPLIGGTGGNVGTQSSALIVQGLANSSLDAQNTWKQIVKESVVAVINATIISMLVYIYNFIRFGASATVTYSVSFSLFAVVMFASIFGTLVPMTLEKLKIDPAIATGPFISITNDIIGMMLYMGITVLLS
ncbi:MAG: magnesium transporter [Phocaeicola vulgatus]|nr:magnesium transporter [Phocaeicola vulgatus]